MLMLKLLLKWNLKVAKEGLEEGRDPNLVGWYSEDDAENPQ